MPLPTMCRFWIQLRRVWLGRPSRLAGTDLNLLNVRYYTLNEKGEIDRLILNDVTGDLWTYGVLDDIKNVAVNYSELQTLAKIISTGKSDSTDTQDKIVDDLKDVLVPTTSEVLWGVINGDILSTLWQKITANTDSLLSLGLRRPSSAILAAVLPMCAMSMVRR